MRVEVSSKNRKQKGTNKVEQKIETQFLGAYYTRFPIH